MQRKKHKFANGEKKESSWTSITLELEFGFQGIYDRLSLSDLKILINLKLFKNMQESTKPLV